MKVVFSPRALSNVEKILADSERRFGAVVANDLEKRLSKAFEQIGHAPDSAPRLANRPHLRVLLLTGYPFRIFYRVGVDEIEIAHVRHTSRRTWLPQAE